MREIFRNRIEAGKLLAEKLMRYANQPNVIVPRVTARRRAGCIRGSQGATRTARCFRCAQAGHSWSTRTGHGCNRVFTGLDLIANDSRLEVRSSVGVQKPLFEMGCERA